MDNTGISFSAKVWYSEWYFITVPNDISKQIREHFKLFEEGWGRLKVVALTGNTEWKTALWFDTKSQTYLLPVKKEVRIKEKIGIGTEIMVEIWIQH